ncbi:MAG: metallophosphoesterase [Planctomycetota bacterium]
MGDPRARHHTPLPTGPLSGRRRRWRRALGKLLAVGNRALERLPPGRFLRERLHAPLEITCTDVAIRGADLDLLHVVLISDVHAGLFLTAEDFRAVAARAAALAPNLVCLVGDLVNTRWREVELLAPGLELLRAPGGVFAVPGNHEYYRPGQFERWTSYLAERGVEVLANRGRRVSAGQGSLWVAGIDDLTEGRPDLDAALSGRRAGEPTLLLSHHPDTFLESCDLSVDLQLSGHTHGGQILIAGRAPLSHSRHGFLAGLYERNGCRLYVGRGVGVTSLPLRIGTRPEVALLRLWGGGSGG